MRSADGGSKEWQLAEPLRGKQFIVLDDPICGHSAFEVHTVLKAIPELDGTLYCLLKQAPVPDVLVYAGWLAGFEIYLTKPCNIDEFARFSKRAHDKLARSDGQRSACSP